MFFHGVDIPAAEFSPAGDWETRISERGYLAFEGEEANIPVGTAAMGYRIFYETPDKRLYPPISHLANFKKWDKGEETTVRGTEQKIGAVNHSPTDEGYYYWANRGTADAYLFTIGADMWTKYRTTPKEELPQGAFVMKKVRGIATRHPSGQAGDVMEDMTIDEDDEARLSWRELFDDF